MMDFWSHLKKKAEKGNTHTHTHTYERRKKENCEGSAMVLTQIVDG